MAGASLQFIQYKEGITEWLRNRHTVIPPSRTHLIDSRTNGPEIWYLRVLWMYHFILSFWSYVGMGSECACNCAHAVRACLHVWEIEIYSCFSGHDYDDSCIIKRRTACPSTHLHKSRYFIFAWKGTPWDVKRSWWMFS